MTRLLTIRYNYRNSQNKWEVNTVTVEVLKEISNEVAEKQLVQTLRKSFKNHSLVITNVTFHSL